ncbi:uncharacterized protein LOC119819729 [Arvicola amphibius]|uniref:uncharacterized protein LOC119819729 n=1 Tax=Arvicola amphibius TaxID=1047088 RepID=UPI001C09CB78|nr:uncharacterized protein LOC119819729 [Arvicola amphibius]
MHEKDNKVGFPPGSGQAIWGLATVPGGAVQPHSLHRRSESRSQWTQLRAAMADGGQGCDIEFIVIRSQQQLSTSMMDVEFAMREGQEGCGDLPCVRAQLVTEDEEPALDLHASGAGGCPEGLFSTTRIPGRGRRIISVKKKKIVMRKIDEPGKYIAFKGKNTVYIQELPVKDHYIFYCEHHQHHGKSHLNGELLGRDPEENPDAMKEFKKFVQSKRLKEENIIVPEQRDQCIPESD